MILADKIINERKKLGISQEELADKLGVSRQAVSKWESAQATPDLNRILQMADLFGVTTDYLLKDSLGSEERAAEETGNGEENVLTVSMEEACAFMKARAAASKQIAFAVALCILSSVLLIVLEGIAEYGSMGLSEGVAAAIGMIVLFAFIGIAVFIFIFCGSKGQKFEWLEQERFETAYGVSGLVKEKKEAYAETYTKGLAAGVVLCVVGCVPLVAAGCMDANDLIITLFVGLLLVLIALGVYLIIRVSMIRGSYDILLQEGDYKKEDKLSKEGRRTISLVSGIYWGLATALYLGWSFVTMEWDKTWIVWPVAGVLFAPVCGITKMILKSKEQ